ncbi:MAG: orotidine-5'-phosphate decarboxylase [Candidatus Marinimicrobia bacterium]|jgi:orotidine-5'-phosphate decarboxylase|nr:orotidine-5'-phosphate decarboxylase [Candidatus Neomarinimicrobiota bacterium]MDP6611759.1 orotidine-5'-phosphate decarboxylase [Candidatus Neomarinimicrobiota bacterium]|tara:strand:- start:37297 stop:38097 length:801 start_codon:yes stop_codon:yes gene_type:complete
MKSFNSRLSGIIQLKESHLCVGLDMNPEELGKAEVSIEDLKSHTYKVIDATRDLAAAFKPNLAFFERWGSTGFKWLEETMEYFRDDVIVIGDGKRGDIGNTVKQYVHSLFDHFGFDAVTLSPYMGKDSVAPFTGDPEKGVFVLCRTSNPSAVDLQNQPVKDELLFDKTAQLCVQWNGNNNVGLVLGATAPEEISRVRSQAPGLPFLIPGIGAQGGDLERSMKDGNTNGDALINVSRGISFAGDLSEKAIRKAAKDYVNQMQEIINP